MINYMNKSDLYWWFLIIAIVGDFTVPYILAIFYKSYNHKLMVMSALGNPNSPVKVYYNICLVALGILLLIASIGIYLKYYTVSKPLSVAIIVLMAMFAIGAGILSGIFSVNENKEIETIASKIHGIGASLGFMALLFVPALLGILSYKSSDKIACRVFTVFFVLAFVFFVLFIMAEKPAFQNTIIKNEGLWQRLTLLFMYMPFGYIAIENLVGLSQG